MTTIPIQQSMLLKDVHADQLLFCITETEGSRFQGKQNQIADFAVSDLAGRTC